MVPLALNELEVYSSYIDMICQIHTFALCIKHEFGSNIGDLKVYFPWCGIFYDAVGLNILKKLPILCATKLD